ncbi:hypothetical protein BCR43DRAFT_487586 [Syncephalastrum racemosum]|uniref:Uncharacterized protein n=1 Tax=Syncephalastrum racemosum TaxID=13706 RepID=A0A1X2HIQ8_SYNRA|nr:hypothetical protein BCR43DRAFT_487586 [Syncephalastrum racemosum]
MDNLLSFLEEPEEDPHHDSFSLNSDVPATEAYAPQPLATRGPYQRRDHIQLKRRNAEFKPYDFRKPIRIERSKSTIDFINPAAIRSRRMYQEIEQEQDFLMQMRKQWCLKLEELKRDRELLMHMASMEEYDVLDSQPLIQYTRPQAKVPLQPSMRAVNNKHAGDAHQQLSAKPMTMDELLTTTAHNTHKSTEEDTRSSTENGGDEAEEDELDLSDLLGDDMGTPQANPELDDLDEEERTRRALTQMLEEFGPEW